MMLLRDAHQQIRQTALWSPQNHQSWLHVHAFHRDISGQYGFHD